MFCAYSGLFRRQRNGISPPPLLVPFLLNARKAFEAGGFDLSQASTLCTSPHAVQRCFRDTRGGGR